MSAIDVLHVADDSIDSVTITVGDRWIEIPTSQVTVLVGALQEITPA